VQGLPSGCGYLRAHERGRMRPRGTWSFAAHRSAVLADRRFDSWSRRSLLRCVVSQARHKIGSPRGQKKRRSPQDQLLLGAGRAAAPRMRRRVARSRPSSVRRGKRTASRSSTAESLRRDSSKSRARPSTTRSPEAPPFPDRPGSPTKAPNVELARTSSSSRVPAVGRVPRRRRGACAPAGCRSSPRAVRRGP
jgi:hypothetical protein